MLKHFKYLFFAAVTLMAATGCQDDPEDTFDKVPTAPVLVNNGSILLTKNTMTEDITWAWSASRWASDVKYTLLAEYGDANAVQVGTTDKLSLTMSKKDFYSLVTGIAGVPQNATYSIRFTVNAEAAEGKASSEPQTVSVYSYGDAVSAVVERKTDAIVLDMNDPEGTIDLLAWEPARLEYNEFITYSVYCSYDGGNKVLMEQGIAGTSYSTTVDALNEFAVAAGAPENAASDISFSVYAVSETYPDGVPSAEVPINITTYVASYPDQLYLPGSYQGWEPATAPTIPASKMTKGLFEAYVDLSTEDGGDVQFKFSPVPRWEGDFGSNDLVVNTDKGYAVANGTTNGSDNLVVPSGVYRISVNMKFKTVELQQVKTMGIIGSAVSTGWGEEIKMEWDAASRSYSVVTTLTQGDEYKFRMNDDWDYSIGDNGAFAGGENFKMDKETGEYKVVLNVASHPYSVKLVSTTFPEFVYLPGDANGWGFESNILLGNEAGQYSGYAVLGGQWGWKITDSPDWDHSQYGFESEGHFVQGGGNIMEGTTAAPYWVVIDLAALTYNLTEVTAMSLIGTVQGNWDTDVDMTWDAETRTWSVTADLAAGEFKIRMNHDWSISLGGDFESMTTQNGANMQIAEAGNYTITLYPSYDGASHCEVVKN